MRWRGISWCIVLSALACTNSPINPTWARVTRGDSDAPSDADDSATYADPSGVDDSPGDDGDAAADGDPMAPAPPVASLLKLSQNPPGTADTLHGEAGAITDGARVVVLAANGEDIIGSAQPAADGSFLAIDLGDNVHAEVLVAAEDAPDRQRSGSVLLLNDIVAPGDPALTTAPASRTLNTSAKFLWTSASDAVEHRCRLDGGSEFGCSSPLILDDLQGGTGTEHNLTIAAIDGAGNVGGPRFFGWTIDTVGPVTTLQGPASLTPNPSVIFYFDSTEAAEFFCKLDGTEHPLCSSPADYDLLAKGEHRFEVYGVDDVGNPGPSVNHVWRVSDGDWLAVAAGADRTCTVDASENIYCWGATADDTPQALPAAVGTQNGFRTVAMSSFHGCSIDSTGRLYCWGENDDGQLGVGDDSDREEPTSVGDDTWESVSTGANHTCGIRTDGTLWCWGDNSANQLGIDTEGAMSPLQVGDADDWLDVAAASYHTCGLRSPGTLWCWGENYNGQLGVGDHDERPTPTQIGTATTWQRIYAGWGRTCGLRDTNDLYCWGEVALGHDGDPTLPGLVSEPGPWLAAALGEAFTCAIKSTGQLYCWGNNLHGQVGGGQAQVLAPTQRDASMVWVEVAAGRDHACARDKEGHLSCWGGNALGQVGTGTAGNKASPVQIGDAGAWLSVATGENELAHTCGVQKDNSLWCWGYNQWGQLGTAAPKGAQVPVRVESENNWTEVAVGYGPTCARSNGTVYCWGSSGDVDPPTHTPAAVVGPLQATGLAVGMTHVCVLGDSWELWCKGPAQYGQTGLQNPPPYVGGPMQVGEGGQPWSRVAAGANSTCGLRDVSLWCWGDNSAGQLGVGISEQNVTTPLEVDPGGPKTWRDVSLASSHACGRREVGLSNYELWCWGSNATGALGDGNTTSSDIPRRVGTSTDWAAVDTGGGVTCGLRSGGALSCWGDGSFEQLGQGNWLSSSSPRVINGAWKLISVGEQYACAIDTGDSLWCWGRNGEGQLGDGTAWVETPTAVTRP